MVFLTLYELCKVQAQQIKRYLEDIHNKYKNTLKYERYICHKYLLNL